MNIAQKNSQAESGFTLVELAIVMIIIGRGSERAGADCQRAGHGDGSSNQVD
jgi:prepilin-type N-terminal cleavage/methylation domain-containing protein